MTERQMTMGEADRTAKWWGGARASAWYGDGRCVVSKPGSRSFFGATFEEAFRASMQAPMTDKDAELEAKLRWGPDGQVWKSAFQKGVGLPGDTRGMCDASAPWERAFARADQKTNEPRGGSQWSVTGIVRRVEWGHPVSDVYPCGYWKVVVDPGGGLEQHVIVDRAIDDAQIVLPRVGHTVCATYENDKPGGIGRPVSLQRVDVPGGAPSKVRLTVDFGAAAVAAKQALDRLAAKLQPLALTRDEAHAEAKRRWGPAGYAFAAAGEAPLVVGKPGFSYIGKDFEEAFWRSSAVPLGRAFAGVARTIQQEENKRVGRAFAKKPPSWAYPAGWQYAVMAAVEWCNTRPEIVDVLFAAPDSGSLHEYHLARLTGVLSAAAIERGAVRLDDDATKRLYRVMCEAYERGRGAPGGGR